LGEKGRTGTTYAPAGGFDPASRLSHKSLDFALKKKECSACRTLKGAAMSWTTINEILGLAAIDHAFCQELLANPLQAVQKRGFQLTTQEQHTFRRIKARDLQDFSQQVLSSLAPDSP
jgi:hypothetical protein